MTFRVGPWTMRSLHCIRLTACFKPEPGPLKYPKRWMIPFIPKVPPPWFGAWRQKSGSLGYPFAGFDACITSDVLSGSGLSPSAAHEVLIGNIINHFSCGGALDAV